VSRARYIHGTVICWNRLLQFLDTLPPWQSMMHSAAAQLDAIDDNFKRTAAAATGTCATNHRFPANLLAILQMISSNRPKPFRWHGQIGPERWKEANSYTGALSGWLSGLSPEQAVAELHLQDDIVHSIYKSLREERTPRTLAMVRRYLCHVVYHLANTSSLAIIGEARKVPKRELRYQDFSPTWRWDGIRCEQLQPTDKSIRDLEDTILATGAAGINFLDYLRIESSPVCHQRVLRHLEVAVYRIGSEWTDPEGLPPGGGGGNQLNRLRADYIDAIARWYDDRGTPEAPGARTIYDEVVGILGTPDERKRALVDCLSFRSSSAEDLQEAAFTWLKTNGCTPLQALEGC